jgi:hypothetical protein
MWAAQRQVRGRCPCGAEHAACGPPSSSAPIDFDQLTQEAAVGGALRKYRVTVRPGVETVMKLNAADAERLGGVPLDAPEAVPAPADVAPEVPPALAAKGRRGAPNKARTTTPNKAGEAGVDD